MWVGNFEEHMKQGRGRTLAARCTAVMKTYLLLEALHNATTSSTQRGAGLICVCVCWEYVADWLPKCGLCLAPCAPQSALHTHPNLSPNRLGLAKQRPFVCGVAQGCQQQQICLHIFRNMWQPMYNLCHDLCLASCAPQSTPPHTPKPSPHKV